MPAFFSEALIQVFFLSPAIDFQTTHCDIIHVKISIISFKLS